MTHEVEDKDPEYAGYICFGSPGGPTIRSSVEVTREKSVADEWVSRRKSDSTLAETSKSISTHQESSVNKADVTDLSTIMGRFRETLGAYHPLINASSVLMPALRAGFIHDRMYGSAKGRLDALESEEAYDVFGIRLDQYPKISRQIRRLRELDQGMVVLPAAVLMGLVSTFDSGIVDSVRVMLQLRPDRFESSSKAISVKDIFQMEDFEDVRQRIVDDEIDALMRGGHDDQVDYIEKNFDLKIKSHYKYWADFIEIFERRNLAAHGDLRVNRRYIQNLKRHGYDVTALVEGQRLELDSAYLKRSADILMEFGMLLVFVLWRKASPAETEASYARLSDEAYELIRDGRTSVAAHLLDFALNKQNAQIPDMRRKTMTINLSNALMKEGDKKAGIKVLDGTDWSACANEFRLCEASLRQDVPEFIRLMELAAPAVSKQDLRDWPVFDWVRHNSDVKDKFQEMYGEPFISDEKTEFEEVALRLGELADQDAH